jgi:hypothetical protein
MKATTSSMPGEPDRTPRMRTTIRHGVIAALRLINNLEIKEEIIYGRMENVERSTLVS